MQFWKTNFFWNSALRPLSLAILAFSVRPNIWKGFLFENKRLGVAWLMVLRTSVLSTAWEHVSASSGFWNWMNATPRLRRFLSFKIVTLWIKQKWASVGCWDSGIYLECIASEKVDWIQLWDAKWALTNSCWVEAIYITFMVITNEWTILQNQHVLEEFTHLKTHIDRYLNVLVLIDFDRSIFGLLFEKKRSWNKNSITDLLRSSATTLYV